MVILPVRPNQPGGVEGYWEGKNGARVGRGWQQAASDTACVRTWVASNAGQVRVLGRATKEYYHRALGMNLRAQIMLNDRVVWPATGDWTSVPLNDLYGAAHDLQLEVKAGDALRFILDRSADPDNAIVAWMPKITVVSDPPAKESADVVRIHCGSQTSYTDQNGNVWSADQFFTGGAPMITTAPIDAALPTAEDQALYQLGREGQDFTYSIPVQPGLYSIRLKFAEPSYNWAFERPFNLSINGREVMHNVDICHVAKGPRKAYEKTFHFLVPDENGNLVLKFTGGFEPMQKSHMAMIQAIEVLPEDKPTLRINCGSKSDFIDWNSSTWTADDKHKGGNCIESKKPVLQASPTLYDQGLYQTARVGKDIRYNLTVPPGLYTVHLKFAEIWLDEVGKRPMNIDVNGKRLKKSWDPGTASGGCGMAADVRMEDITPNASGQIVIHVSAAGTNEAILQGIEIE